MPTVENLVVRYVDEQTRNGRFRGQTPKGVTSTLFDFASVVGPGLDVGRLNRRHVKKWRNGLKVKANTQRSYISRVRAFCAWLVDNDHVKADSSRGVQGPKLPRRLPRGLRSGPVGQLFDVLPDSRAEAIVSLMVQEGLRCCEVAALQFGDVDFDEQVVLVNGKGGHQRVLPLSSETVLAVKRYLGDWPGYGGPLIRGYKNPLKGLTAGTVSGLVGGWMYDAGIKAAPRDGVSAHALRHTAATDMLRAGAHVRDVQAVLGHSSLATTEAYMPWIVGELREAMGGREYRRRPLPLT